MNEEEKEDHFRETVRLARSTVNGERQDNDMVVFDKNLIIRAHDWIKSEVSETKMHINKFEGSPIELKVSFYSAMKKKKD